MNKYVRRLVYFTDDGDEKLSPLIYLFLFMTVVYSVAFMFFPPGESNTLYTVLHHFGADKFWAGTGLTVLVLNNITFIWRIPPLSKFVAMLGFLMWLYAVIVTFAYGAAVVGLAVAVPNLLFWVWYYFKTVEYERVTGWEFRKFISKNPKLNKRL